VLIKRLTDTLLKTVDAFRYATTFGNQTREYTLTFHRHSYGPASFLSHIWWAYELSRGPCQIGCPKFKVMQLMGVHNYDAQQHRAGQIISRLTLTITIVQMLSVGGERELLV